MNLAANYGDSDARLTVKTDTDESRRSREQRQLHLAVARWSMLNDKCFGTFFWLSSIFSHFAHTKLFWPLFCTRY